MIPLVVLVSFPFLLVCAFFPVLRRLAIRNALRRPRETALVIAGSLLGTAILTASFVVGDTLEASLKRTAYTQLGPIDQVVTVPAAEAVDVTQRLEAMQEPAVHGVLPMTTMVASVATTGDPRRASPRSQLVELDFARASAMGTIPAVTGMSGATPQPGSAAVGDELAAVLGVGSGDTIEIYAYGQTLAVQVDRILPRRGIAGFGQGAFGESRNLFVAPGTIASLSTPDPSAGFGMFGAMPAMFNGPASSGSPVHLVAISNTGEVEAGAAQTGEVVSSLETVLAGTGAEIRPVKRQALAAAEGAGSMFTLLFTAMGSFGIIAGILLLVNIFVMLAEERRSELGMLRAVGMRRSWLVAAFATEGWLYGLVAAAVGAVVGIGLGNAVAAIATGLFSSFGPASARIDVAFSATASSVQTGFALGFLIAVATVVLTSVRISRFNVIHAIRDITQEPSHMPGSRTLLAGAAAVVVGAVWLGVGAAAADGISLFIAPLALIAGLTVLAMRVVGNRRIVVSAGSLAALAWGIIGMRFFRSAAGGAGMYLFVAQGLVLTGSAVVLVSQNQDLLGNAVRRLGARMLGLRLALAYPLARRFRTGMTLAMYTLVIFTLTFISVFSHVFSREINNAAQQAAGGFDLVVTSSPTNPVDPEALAGHPEVSGIAPLYTSFAQVQRGSDDNPRSSAISAFDTRWVQLGPPPLADKGTYETDEAVYRAVLDDPQLIIASSFSLGFGGMGSSSGPPDAQAAPQSSNAEAGSDRGPGSGMRGGFGSGRGVRVGDQLTISNPFSGQSRTVTVAATASGFGVPGSLYGMQGMHELFGESVIPTPTFVATSSRDIDRLAAEISGAHVEHGVEAISLASQIAQLQEAQLGFFGLIRGYLALGLLVGIAGLGVIMVRAVRERRRQIGVLRALGFDARTVRRSFVLESGFVALEGVLIGVTLALVTSYSVFALSGAFDQTMRWSAPVVGLTGIVGFTLVASLIATAAPSQAASRIRPAVALRITD